MVCVINTLMTSPSCVSYNPQHFITPLLMHLHTYIHPSGFLHSMTHMQYRAARCSKILVVVALRLTSNHKLKWLCLGGDNGGEACYLVPHLHQWTWSCLLTENWDGRKGNQNRTPTLLIAMFAWVSADMDSYMLLGQACILAHPRVLASFNGIKHHLSQKFKDFWLSTYFLYREVTLTNSDQSKVYSSTCYLSVYCMVMVIMLISCYV